jgi:hypothetical protein
MPYPLMRSSYTLVIVDGNYDGYKKLASFLFVINAVIFFIMALGTNSVSAKLILFMSASLIGVYAFYNWKYKKRKENSFILIYILISAVWITDTSYWYFGIFFLILLYLQLKMEKYFTLHIDHTAVTVNGFLKRTYEWASLNNVMLKDDLLTIDLKSNKIMQVTPDWPQTFALTTTAVWSDVEDYRATEREFNEFCREQLNK